MNIFEMNYYLFITNYLHSELINLIIVSNENFRFGRTDLSLPYNNAPSGVCTLMEEEEFNALL
jgi:hypothetical protein